MAYSDFAYWYDALNGEADYDGLAAQIIHRLKLHGITDGLIADLGCGTGELTLRLSAAGYDMIGVDASPDMLGVFQAKLAENKGQDILLLCQRLEELDLYGTIKGAVSTFDTLNHLSAKAFEAAIERVSLFMETGGVFIADMNTPYKHASLLADTVIPITSDDSAVSGRWQNSYNQQDKQLSLTLEIHKGGERLLTENITEYTYDYDYIRDTLNKHALSVFDVIDGESFGPLTDTSHRMLITAVKQ